MSNDTSLTVTSRSTPAAVLNLEVVDFADPAPWATAKEYWEAAGKFEECKLYAQAMCGMELKAIQNAMGATRGGDRRSKSQNETLKFSDLAQQHLGFSRSHTARLMQMGDALRKRMKKLPGLRDFAVLTLSVSSLSEEQVATLRQGVRKLTDGVTQQELFKTLGIYTSASGGTGGFRQITGGTGSDNSPEQAAATAKDIATADWTALDLMLRGYGDKFLVLPDADVTVQIAALEIALKARQKWLAKPRAQRDPQALSAWLNGQLTGKATAADA